MVSEKEKNAGRPGENDRASGPGAASRDYIRFSQNPGGALREGWQVRDDIAEPEKLRSITFLDFISPEADGK